MERPSQRNRPFRWDEHRSSSNRSGVEATTSTESKRVVTEFEKMVGSTDEDGTLRSSLKDYAVLHVTGDLVVLQQVLMVCHPLNLSQQPFHWLSPLRCCFC